MAGIERTDYSHIVLGKAETVVVYTVDETTGKTMRSTHYYDQDGNGALDGYTVYKEGRIVKDIHGAGATRFAAAFRRHRAAATAKYLGAATRAVAADAAKHNRQCLGFDQARSVRFEHEGLRFSIWVLVNDASARVTNFRVDRSVDTGMAMRDLPMFISPGKGEQGQPVSSALDAFQSLAAAYRALCE